MKKSRKHVLFHSVKKGPKWKKVDARKFGYDYKVYRVHKQQGKPKDVSQHMVGNLEV